MFLGMGKEGESWGSEVVRLDCGLNMSLKDRWLWLGIKKLELLYLGHEDRKAGRHSTRCLTNFLYVVSVAYQA